MIKRMKHDLTQGSIGKNLIMFFLPIAAGTLFQQLYNAVDAIIVGKFVGTIALASVGGSTAQITNLLIGFFVALSGGATVLIAQLFGAKDEERLHRATGTGIAFCLIIGAVLTVVGIVFTRPMLALLKSPADTINNSTIYLRIYFSGVIAQLLYNIEAGILRAVGDSRSPFIYSCISCVTNIVFDLLFVVAFHWGVIGVAVATVLSQVLSAFLATVKLCRSNEAYRIVFREIGIDIRLLKEMMRLGIPAGLQSLMYAVSNMIIQVAVNMLGTVVVASWALAGKIDGFYWACSSAAGIAVMNFSAQNFGAGRLDRVKEGQKFALKAFTAITIGFSITLIAVGKLILPYFSDDAAVVQTSYTLMLYFVPFYFTWTYIEIISGVLRGVGDAVNPVIILGIGVCLFRVFWIFVVYKFFPYLITVCLTYPVSWTLTDIAFFIYYKKGSWHQRIQSKI